ncbi:hydroxymethylglutaryl-CoA lyase [Massilibacterium senegalense]|uniref:hydroxymethylglutaryl-CoA lyase n=1 Tax=Massilibacterium senegalense TaxID=1632858 RepID=UPI00078192AE|nr:hydroxymethylglutaryl-CoA lyase [Massilibacterium senegalense]
MFPSHVTIKEVGPRDGLQNEQTFVPTETKIQWIEQLSETGLSYIEVTSFVHPKWIPQLKDAEEVLKNIEKNKDVTYAALIPNRHGLERAIQVGLDEASVFMSATNAHNKKNINKSTDEAIVALKQVIAEAKQANIPVRGYLSTVFGCPYEGKVSVEKVKKISYTLLEAGIYELSLGDTIGVANPKQVEYVLRELLKEIPKDKLALHFHNTRGFAIANIYASLQLGMATFDSALGGLGGCPYAKGASGNVATDDVVHFMHELGVETGIKEEALFQATRFIEPHIDHPLTSHSLKVNREQCV